MMKMFTRPLAILGLCLLAACEIASNSATLYEFDDRSWIVVRDTKTTGDATKALGGALIERLVVAVRQPDGSYRIVATRFVDDTIEGEGRVSEIVADAFKQASLGDSGSQTLDLIEVLQREGKRISNVNPSAVMVTGRTVTFPEDAIIIPFEEREEDGGMY